MRFTKMQGIGNDYVYVDCFAETLPKPPEHLAVEVSRAHYGIGADGLILIGPSGIADASMRVFNADGSEAMMCGNGIRCVGKYLYDSGRAKKDQLVIDTPAGLKHLSLQIEGGACVGATVDMGEPVLVGAVTVGAAGRDWALVRVSMGNPHAVAVVDALPQDALFFEAGAAIERNPIFPDRANVEFARVTARDGIEMRVWERGSGETLACGTGACAVLAACASLGLTDKAAYITLKGGQLFIEWRGDRHIYMTGPAVTVFTGEW